MKKTIRLWKIGDHTQGVLPTEEAVEKLVKMLNDPDTTDIVWDTMISVECIEIDTDEQKKNRKKGKK